MLTEWRTIPNTNGRYEVSNTGLIRNLKTQKLLVQTLDNRGGYFQVRIYPETWKRQFRIHVHKCVARSFIGEKSSGMHVNHRDGNKLNNRVDNLEYVTQSDNTYHAKMMGLFSHGTHRYNAKLNANLIRVIRSLHECGLGCRKIGTIMNISSGTISSVISGRTWNHVK